MKITVALNIRVSPELGEKIDQLVKAGLSESKNALVNTALAEYVRNNESALKTKRGNENGEI